MTNDNISRRKFINVSTALGAMAAFGATPPAWSQNRKQRVAVVGTGTRSTNFYIERMQETHRKFVDVVGFCDKNQGRLELAQRQSKERIGEDIPAYIHTDFDRMIAETKPDVVLVTTMDSTHHIYIIRAMELGCDVITEKPMTVDAEKCQAIINAQKKHGKSVTVTFNYRYSPPRTQIKEILSRGDIGDILSVDFHWLLNTHHGADYFRRWHANKENSGGLMVHKATHHFDLMNWWLSAVPETVFAQGKREYYTPEMAKRMGLSGYHERCHTCPEADKCGFYMSLADNKNLKELYLDNEKYDGYFRDKCVFRPDIDIEDNINVIVKYDNGVDMSYSLNAFNSWEGHIVTFNGTKGRLEHKNVETVYVSGDGGVQGEMVEGGTTTKVIPLRGPEINHEIWQGIGGHGGGDTILLNDLFDPNVA
ncbi:MAG: Gfo/Idh/MocA family oxidoreductase, partial [Kordiimonadaceae bacterium]|nr:Gfo/Idh/MocA family oxidoreductase [Kordiimonadaceae bacterium]